MSRRTLATLVALTSIAVFNFAQQASDPPDPVPHPLTLRAAIEYATAHYPAIRAATERKAGAQAAVGLAKTEYLPTANALWQGNRATRNNIFGLLLPQSVVPSISGPVLPTTNNVGVWGSAAGVLVGWEPFDFGYRSSKVAAAKAGDRSAGAELQLSRVQIGADAAGRFLALAAAQLNVVTASANVERRESFGTVVHTLVKNELRPGVEASRADAELAAARIVLIRAQTQEKIARIALSDLLGCAPADIVVDSSDLSQTPSVAPASSDVATNPVLVAQRARADAAAADVRVVNRAYYPHFQLQSALSARGTGANVDGTTAGGTTGLDLQRENWALGMTATFSPFELFAARQRKKIAEANERLEQSRLKQVIQDLNAQVAEAQANYEGALAISQATPVELDSARQNESQARARYQAGLTNVIEVADAQSLLVKAEAEDNLARLNVWRAVFDLALARGDLAPAITELSNSVKGGH